MKNIIRVTFLFAVIFLLFCGKKNGVDENIQKEKIATVDSNNTLTDSLSAYKKAKIDSLNRIIDKEMQAMVAGLVFDSTVTVKKNNPKSIKKSSNKKSLSPKPNNSEKLLEYRGMESIKTSIQKHSATVQAIYKKNLKLDSNMSGSISVKFTVLPDGKVEALSIVKSDIENTKFREEFINYLKNITFKEIPSDLGSMYFVFPFEFSNR